MRTKPFLEFSGHICFIICRYVFNTQICLLTLDHMTFVPHLVSRIYSYFVICLYLISWWFCCICYLSSSKYHILVSCFTAITDDLKIYFKLSLIFKTQILTIRSMNLVLDHLVPAHILQYFVVILCIMFWSVTVIL